MLVFISFDISVPVSQNSELDYFGSCWFKIQYGEFIREPKAKNSKIADVGKQ